MTLLLAIVKRARRDHVAWLLGIAVAIVVVGGWVFSIAEHLSFGTGIYWAITTATTVGYGDVTPKNAAGRVIASVVMLTVIPVLGAVFASVAGATVVSHLRRLLGMESPLPDGPFTLIAGGHPVVARVCAELADDDERVVVVNPERPANLPEATIHVPGDPQDGAVLAKAGIRNARRALIACDEDTDALIVAITVHTLAPDLEVYALAESTHVARALEELGVRHTLSSTELLGHTVAKSMETPVAGDVLLSLLDTEDYVLEERPVGADLAGSTLAQVRADFDGLVLGMARQGSFDVGLGDAPTLADGDHLVVLVRRPARTDRSASRR